MNARTDIPLGLFHGMPNATYHAGPGLSCSGLADLKRSPRHFYALHLDPQRPQRAATPAMQAGTLAHCAILEPDAFATRYAVKPAGHDGRTKEGKAWNEAHAGLELISAEQFRVACSQVAAVHAVPELDALLQGGSAEVSAYWLDAGTGAHCRCRPDWVHPLADGRVILLDVKTTADAGPDAFARSVWNYGYHRQAAWYSTGYAAAAGVDVAAFVFAAVSNEYPFIAVAYVLDDETLQRGAAECSALVQTYAECVERDEWPAFGDGVQTLAMPAWAK